MIVIRSFLNNVSIIFHEHSTGKIKHVLFLSMVLFKIGSDLNMHLIQTMNVCRFTGFENSFYIKTIDIVTIKIALWVSSRVHLALNFLKLFSML